MTQGLVGSFAPADSMRKILGNTGLIARKVGPSSFVLERSTSAHRRKRPVAGKPARKAAPTKLASVIVTANLRDETYDRFAGSITPLTGTELDRIGAHSMKDYLGTVPGVSFAALTPGLSNVTIRGVGTTTGIDSGQQTTGMYIDGIPLTEAFFNMATPDIDTFDVNRVEVLKGPQGTAFGTGSMGGAVNYITNKPLLGWFDNRFRLGVSQVNGNGSLGHLANAMLNMPVSKDIAVRLVVDDRRDPGYIDNLGTHRENANTSNIYGGRFLVKWKIDDTTSLNWMTLYQRIKNSDIGFDMSIAGVMQTDTMVPQKLNTSVAINSMKFKHDYAWASFSVTASSHKKTQYLVRDYTIENSNALFKGLASPVIFYQYAYADGHTAEARLTSHANNTIQWLVGSIYNETIINYNDPGYAPGASNAIDLIYGAGLGASLAPNDRWYKVLIRVRGQQSALYGQVSWAFRLNWKLTLGGRYYSTRVSSRHSNGGLVNYLLTGSTTDTVLMGDQKNDGISPMGSLSYQVNNRTMLYGLISTGFRYGGPNIQYAVGARSMPATFGPDKLTNYEIGVRTSNQSKSWTAGVTTYFIHWKDIQLGAITPVGVGYEINGGDAYSYGMETTYEWRPTRHFVWRGSLGFNLAKLVDPYQPFPGRVAPAGTPLPGSSKWQASSNATYDFGGKHHPFITATFQYRSKATADLFDLKPKLGNYSIYGLRLGFSVDHATFTAYVENLSNKKGISNLGVVTPTYLHRSYITPRTFGILSDFTF